MLVERLAVFTEIARTLTGVFFSVSAVVLERLLPICAKLDRITVQVRQVASDDSAAGVRPGSLSDAISRVDGVRALRAEIRTPYLSPAPA